jgi:hypothetical protein
MAAGPEMTMLAFTQQRPQVRDPCHTHLTKDDPWVDNDAKPIA